MRTRDAVGAPALAGALVDAAAEEGEDALLLRILNAGHGLEELLLAAVHFQALDLRAGARVSGGGAAATVRAMLQLWALTIMEKRGWRERERDGEKV